MTEEQLIKGCKNNDALAQRKLFDLYAKKMMGICLRYAKSREDAEDVLQEGFVRVFKKIGSFKKEGSFEGWMRRVFVNISIEAYRRDKSTLHDSIETDGLDIAIPAGIIEQLSVQDILEAIKTLPTGYQTVFNLYAIEGYGHKEIAEQLGISEGTSKSQYHGAKKHLQKMIQKEVVK